MLISCLCCVFSSNNLMYPSEDFERRRLTFFCKRCSHVEAADSNCVFTNHLFSADSVDSSSHHSKDLVKDPTLPRDKTLSCPVCDTVGPIYFAAHSKNENEAMRLSFVCVNPECLHIWKQARGPSNARN